MVGSIGWREYRDVDGTVVNAFQTRRERRIPTPAGIDLAYPGDYVVQDTNSRLWVARKSAFEGRYFPVHF